MTRIFASMCILLLPEAKYLMLPSVSIGSLSISMYGVMLFVGLYAGFVYSYFKVYRQGRMSRKAGLRLLLSCGIGGAFLLFGAAFFDALFHSIEEGRFVINGITYLGGVVVGFPAAILSIRYLVPDAKGKQFSIFSTVVPSIVLAHGVGRIGCFFAGCCYGRETASWIGVQFPHLAYRVIPVQLFEAGFEFLLFTVLVILDKRVRGHQLEIYLHAYSVFRFFAEFWRGDSRGVTGLIISPAQLLSLLCIAGAVVLLVLYKKGVLKNAARRETEALKENEGIA